MPVFAKVGTELAVETQEAGMQSEPTMIGLHKGGYPDLTKPSPNHLTGSILP